MEIYYEKYARLMLEAGVDLQRGQKIHIQLESYHLRMLTVFWRMAR